MMNTAWLATPSVQVNPSSQRALNEDRFFWILLEIPHSGVKHALTQQIGQRQLGSLCPHSLGNLLDQQQRHHNLFRLFFAARACERIKT